MDEEAFCSRLSRIAKQSAEMRQKEPDPTHPAMYGVELEKKLKEGGVEVVLAYPGREETQYRSMAKLLIEKLTGKE